MTLNEGDLQDMVGAILAVSRPAAILWVRPVIDVLVVTALTARKIDSSASSIPPDKSTSL